MKLWDRRFESEDTIPLLEAFNASIKEDRFLYWAEIEASLAYARALYQGSVLSSDECEAVVSGLERVRERIENDEDLNRFEDIHSAVELLLTEEIGETGKKLHTGRSRNEQVATDERLYLKKRIPEIVVLLKGIQEAVIRLAEDHFDVVMPGFTHLQQGQCVLFSHYILSLFWQMERGKSRLQDALRRMDALPLGAGALAGSTAPLDREYMRELLGFGSVMENSMDAVSDRSFILEVLFGFALILLDLSRFSEDLIIFSSQEFGYLDLDDSIVTSSSLMPQKRNPDYFELVRTGPAKLFGMMSQLFIAVKGLPSTYNKDLQEDKGPLRHGVEETIEMLDVFRYALTKIRPNQRKILERLHSFLFATDLVDYLVEKGIAFREAHGIVCGLVSSAEKTGKPLDAMSMDAFQEHSKAFDTDVFQVFDPMRSIRRKKTVGSTHPDRVREQIEEAKIRVS